MKFIYVFVFSCFLLNGFAQDLKIGIVDKDAVTVEMQEFKYLDSIRNIVYASNCRLGELMEEELERRYIKTLKRISCFPLVVQRKAEAELQIYQDSILNYGVEVAVSDSLYQGEIIKFCNNVMNHEVDSFLNENKINFLIDKTAIIYAENEMIYTEELIKFFRNRKEMNWNSEELMSFSENLKNQYNFKNKKIQEVINWLFCKIK